MSNRIHDWLLALLAWCMLNSAPALGQLSRAPSKAPDMSIEKLWQWLAAKPGVLIAGGVAIAVLLFMLVTRGKKSKS